MKVDGKFAIFLVVSIIAIWTILIVASGLKYNPLSLDWDFGNTASFGESFGGLGVLFAASAAVFTFVTLRDQREEIARSRLREKLETDASLKRDFENTFFGLLNYLQTIVAGTDIQSSSQLDRTGRDAFKKIYLIYRKYRIQNSMTPDDAWKNLFQKYVNDLGHYFRFLYHIVVFIDRSAVADKSFYIRLLRASMSDAELALLALNCEYGAGRDKFKSLVEKHALLHNLDSSTINELQIADKFKPAAFGLG